MRRPKRPGNQTRAFDELEDDSSTRRKGCSTRKVMAVVMLIGLMTIGFAKFAEATVVGSSSTCDFEVELGYDETFSLAVDSIPINCWQVQAKDVSAEYYHTYWWYYPYATTYGYWDGWQSRAYKSWNVIVANYGRASYCGDPNNDCSDEPNPSITGWYWGQ